MSKKRVIWNGIEYESIASAAKALNISYEGMYDRVTRKGYAQDSDLQSHSSFKRAVSWDGVRYISLAEAARALGVDISTMFYYVEQGYTSSSDIDTSRRPGYKPSDKQT